ncbi:MAG: Na+/H+ antiporter NhaC family protein [Lachnospiraceae bacterium]|jgi:Na+/H+ antiporter NhaC|nr:Na+/H+ antiporter NhaC family protein [Lachnospiraceae bacterium]MCH4063108.1 Na+/H+ antiporter NhaC family protein [Lachnospiraceae bacterium]MCH4104416.1 Na+/H+ antiporter NhaC family protein [Lachnospiraceae bacterium]MCI1308389.1 Na+/H+ antiporter NhaC family protein [Lachnospiraceae bacterium]MCI1333213.1 Na+/H+ antiporter NhaC family protein [Lachnospiraceae bacterium]
MWAKLKDHGKKIAFAVVAVFLIIAACVTTADSVQKTFWALVPPIIAIGLALVTKEVYSSLFIGILSGAMLYSGFSFTGTLNHTFKDGVVSVLSDSYNVGILIFLVILGIMVQLMNRTGGSAAFGKWASSHIKTRVGAQLATIALGILIFIDDYFNCLTVGSVMRPVTDKHHVSRAKLAYLIDATAAPVCIIAPISSWAAAVSGFVKGQNGIDLFVHAIPFNYYALLTIAMMFMLTVLKVDYGPMARHEYNAIYHNDLYTTPDRPYANAADEEVNTKGIVADMLVPIITLVVFCVIGMLYTGGFFSGKGLVEAFAGSDASVGLVLGSFCALVVTIAYYLVRRVLCYSEIMSCFPEGFKQMVPAILILVFAWSLKAMTDSLGAKEYVAMLVNQSKGSFQLILPVIIFLIAVGLSFATGTSWGTFGILIPIVTSCFEGSDYNMMIISISACMAGAVCGDHCSPISDTTIMSSAGAQSDHLNHVSTQMPYAMTAAAVSAVSYLIATIVERTTHSLVIAACVGLPCGLAILLVILLIVRKGNAARIAQFKAEEAGAAQEG